MYTYCIGFFVLTLIGGYMSKENFLERSFKLKTNGTSVRTEVMAGLTTFMTMAYILAVNPLVLSATGMDQKALFTATALSAVVGTLMMAFLAKYPFALAPGMGLNAFFAYTVVLGMGHSWQFALTAVFIEGLIFIALSAFKVREMIFDSIPLSLKKAVSVGIGLFIALIGAINGGIVTSGKIGVEGGKNFLLEDGLVIKLADLNSGPALVTIIGLIITAVLLIYKVKGALLIGIVVSTIVAIPMGVTRLPEAGIVSLPPSLAPIAFKFEFASIFTFDMLIVVLSFLFVDIFDTIGTLVGVASKTKMLDENGKLPRISQALMSDAVATVTGSCLGTSTVTTFVESSAGVAEGGRTGLTSLTTSVFFALSLFFAPLFGIVPSSATAPALILVGLFMMSPIKEIDFSDYTEAVPAFLTIVMMPFAYSIADGITFGMMSYVLLKVLSGKAKTVSVTMYILFVLFLCKFIFLS